MEANATTTAGSLGFLPRAARREQ